MPVKKHILPFIVFAQFMCTSLWFAGNAIMPDLAVTLNLMPSDIGYMTSSVQFGFIIGTLIYATLTIADRFKPSGVFLISALLGAFFNTLIALETSFVQVLIFRFMTGFFLAGIYPVGMKIASDYYEKGLGKALSFLVGALVLGTALPHLIASHNTSFDWQMVLFSTSGLAVLGGLLIKIFVGEGPHRGKLQVPKFGAMGQAFQNKEFRGAVFGYFGHMWELYAFWAFVPIMIRLNSPALEAGQISFQSFLIIAIGALACFIGGFLSEKFGAQRMARIFLLLSGLCCLFSPIGLELSGPYFIVFMIFWGMVVIADSPLFSTLVAQRANPDLKGTALTIVTSIGFAITIVSIQLLSYLVLHFSHTFIYVSLAIGPAFGLYFLRKNSRKNR